MKFHFVLFFLFPSYRVDESHLTGESDDVSKDPIQGQALYSGSKVVSGFGRMIVTAVGTRSQAGAVAEMIAAAGEGRFSTNNSTTSTITSTSTGSSGSGVSSMDDGKSSDSEQSTGLMPVEGLGRLREETVLQRKLAGYASTIGQLGLGAAVIATSALMARFSYDTFLLQQLPWDWTYLHAYLSFFITGVTILVRERERALRLKKKQLEAFFFGLLIGFSLYFQDSNRFYNLSIKLILYTSHVFSVL